MQFYLNGCFVPVYPNALFDPQCVIFRLLCPCTVYATSSATTIDADALPRFVNGRAGVCAYVCACARKPW